MLSSAARKPVTLSDTQIVARSAGNALTRKIWLPRLLYEALPWFYLGAGCLAFFATLYVNAWFWVVPHYLLFSAACLHLGIFVLYRRRFRDHAASRRDGESA